jgi:hypothetical protein
VRVLHHVRQQRAEDRIVEVVDCVVTLADSNGCLGVAVDEGVEYVMHHLGRDSRHLRKKRQRLDLAHVLEQRNALRDILCIIADALDDARNLQRRDDVSKVARHRCPKRDQLDCAPLRLNLQYIELLVVLDDLGRTFDVALDEAAHGLADRMFRQSAHLADQRAKAVEILVEGFERMFPSLLHGCSNQPKRPVI